MLYKIIDFFIRLKQSIFDKADSVGQFFIRKYGLFGYVINFFILFMVACAVYFLVIAIFGTHEKSWKALKKIGMKYENKIVKSLIKNNYLPFRNILIKKNLGIVDTTEIDMAFVDRKGIYFVECKSREGKKMVLLPLTNEPWLIIHHNESETMNNPFVQNIGHINAFLKELYESSDLAIPTEAIYNIVCLNADWMYNSFGKEHYPFTDNTELLAKNRYVMAGESVDVKRFKKKMSEKPDIFTDDEVVEISEFLKKHMGTEEQLKVRDNAFRIEELKKSNEEYIRTRR